MNDTTPPVTTVLIMAGGTGGHVFPALAAASSLREKGIHVAWLGTKRGIEAKLVPAANIPINYITVTGLRGKGIRSLIKAPLQLFKAVWQSLQIIRQLKPVCVLGLGGFASGPGGVAAWLLRKPLVIHEQNAVAGTTNRLLSVIARRVLQGYPIDLGGVQARYIGNPVRNDITLIDTPEQRFSGRKGALNLLVLGGSLGSKPLNDALPRALASIPAEVRPNVRHQSGEKHIDALAAAYTQAGVTANTDAFIDDMAGAYGWADLVLCRAGALTVAELMAAGVGSVLVPLPHAIDDHQTENARWLTSNGAGILLPQGEMSAEKLASLLMELTGQRPKLLEMAVAARKLAMPNAAEQLAESCLEVANG